MDKSSRSDGEALREGRSRRNFDLWIFGEGRDIEELLTMYLESQGHRAFHIEDVAEAVGDKHRYQELDGVVVNVTSDRDGAERAVRMLHEMRPDLGILVMVGAGDIDFQRRLYAAGATQVIQKPCDPRLLVTKIERTAARSAGNLYPEASDDRPVDRSVGLEGSLSVIHVSDLLLVLSQNQNSGWLEVRVGDDRYRLAVGDGEVRGAAGPRGITGRKAARRAIRRTRGTFAFREVDELSVPSRMADQFERVDNLVLLAVQEADELPRLLEALPPIETGLTMHVESRQEVADVLGGSGARALTPLLERSERISIGELIDESPSPDLQVAKMLQRALDEELVVTAPDTESTSEHASEATPARERVDTPSSV